jgi:polysaccharide biosynthesis/export protein
LTSPAWLPKIVSVRRWLVWLALLPGVAGAQEYEIGPGDVLHVIVLDQPGLTGDFSVDAEGMIAYPFLGRLKASAMSAPGVERKLTTLLADGYLKRPQVSVAVKEFGSQRVFVTGEFQKPGAYSLKADRSLLTLLGGVGEMTPEAGHEIVVIRPPKPGAVEAAGSPPAQGTEAGPDEAATASEPTPEPTPSSLVLPGQVPGSEVFRISLRELRSGDPSKDIRLEARDTVYLPKTARIYIIGHVARPGPYRFEEGLTVFQALLLAGGATERGSSHVKIVRIVDGKTREMPAKMTDPVLPEDTLKVPERFF